jgi:hypothetical protein
MHRKKPLSIYSEIFLFQKVTSLSLIMFPVIYFDLGIATGLFITNALQGHPTPSAAMQFGEADKFSC